MKVGDFNITVGADPELAVHERGTGYVSAHGLIPGTKKEPFKVSKGAIQVDGMAAEFNIDPADTFEEFNNNIDTVIGELRRYIGPDYSLVAVPSATYSKQVWDGVPEEAKELGCDPDYNAYTGEKNEAPDADQDFRTFSGHVHIGWTQGEDIEDFSHLETCMMLVQELDARLGFPSTFLDNTPDALKRRSMYGKAGAFRPKPYGVEYRVLSNFWLKHPKYRMFVYNSVIDSFKRLVEGRPTFGRADFQQYVNMPTPARPHTPRWMNLDRYDINFPPLVEVKSNVV